jgi:hypothetical protein
MPNNPAQATGNEMPFERGTTWSVKWVPQNSSEMHQLEYSIIKVKKSTFSNNYYTIDIKSNRLEYAGVSTDGFMSYNSAGVGTTYLFFLQSKGTTKTINCGFKDIKSNQINIKGVSYLMDKDSKEDINPIYYFSLYKGDYSNVGTCTLEKL